MGWGSHPDTMSMYRAKNGGWFHSYIIQALQDPRSEPIQPETPDFEKSDRYYKLYSTIEGCNSIYYESTHQQRKEDYISALRGDQP